MGSEELLELEACGESDVGRWLPVGVELPWGEGEGLCEELFRFEPTRFLKRAFMEFISQRKEEKAGDMGGVDKVRKEELTIKLGAAALPNSE
jgi:hypothetical protein